MSGRLRFLLATALSFAFLSFAQAGPFGHVGELPSGFLRGLEYQDLAKFYSVTSIEAVSAGASFDPVALSPDSFEHAASRGLASLAVAGRTPSLEEFLAIASVGRGLYETSTDGGDVRPEFESSGPDTLYGPGITFRNLAQVLINRPEGQEGSQNAGPTNQAGNAGFSLFNVIMDTQLDVEFVETAAEIVTPTVTMDGVIALNFLGLRDFAFLISPVTNQIQVMDFKSGTTLNLSNSNYDSGAPDPLVQQQQASQRPQARTAHPRVTVHALLAQAKKAVVTYLLHPFTLGSLLLFSIFWIVLRIARRAS